jgi:protein involved in polysaccharide export with SLBB domain
VFLSCVLVAVPALLQAQTEAEKEQLIKQAQTGILQKLTPEQLQSKLKELGLTEEEARRKAKERGLRLEDFITGGKGAGTKIEVAQPGAAAIEVKVPSQSGQSTDSTTMVVQHAVREEIKAQSKPEPSGLSMRVEPEVGLQKEPGAQELPLFGMSIFQTRAESFQPTPSISDKEYVIGSGDALKLSLWGTVEMMNEFTVDSEGRITIPTVGPVFLSGYTLERAKERLMRAMSKSYAGLMESPPTIYMDVSISKLRPVRVFIMGEVSNPGGYYVSNFANVFNSLFVVNGPKASGSMRQVQVTRNNKLVSKVDLYDYLIGAPKSNDLRVNDNDIIFVPLRGRTVGIKGEVLRPARYELLPGEQLSKLLDFSGGVRTNMYLDRVQVDRIIPFDQRKKGEFDRRIFDIDFSQIAKGKGDYALEDGDIVTIYPIVDVQKNFVDVSGAVWRPGRYQLEKVPSLLSLILAADSLHPTVYMDRADIMRTEPDKRLTAIHVDLDKVLQNDPSHNIKLEPLDRVRIFSIYDFNPARSYTLSGHVKSPGSYPYADSLTLYDIVTVAGGMKDSLFRAQTYLPRADIKRLNEDKRTRRDIPFDLGALLETKDGNMRIEPDDEIVLYSWAEMKEPPQTVQIEGAVRRPGTYPLLTNLTLYDLIMQTSGLTDTLFRRQVLLERADLVRVNPDRISRRIISFNLGKLIDSREGDVPLEPGDRVILFPISTIEIADRTVGIYGRIKKPGEYQLSNEMTLLDLLLQAGGYTTDAWAVQAEISRMTRIGLGKDSLVITCFASLPDLFDSTKTHAQLLKGPSGAFILQNHDQVYVRPNPDYLPQRTVLLEGEVKHPGTYVLSTRNERVSDVVRRAGGMLVSAYARGGSLVRDGQPYRANLEDALDDPRGPEDVILQPGDQLRIPQRPFTVVVQGEVRNPGIYAYVDGRNKSYYLDRAGEVTDSADVVLISLPEGYVIKAGVGWLSTDPSIPDGATITVTKKTPEPPPLPTENKEIDWSATIKDSFAIIASAATIVYLISQVTK